MATTNLPDNDLGFAGDIPRYYERCLVPLIFEPYAVDICRRVVAFRPDSVLELAAGTGVVTRHLASQLAPGVPIVATDLNQAMLDEASRAGTVRPVEWRPADAMRLPFADHAFDVVVCQFGVMFFPDKVRAFSEARRVLRPGGRFVFNTWDRVEHNDLIRTVCGALDALFPDAPPRFMQRGPHAYADEGVIAGDLAHAGFTIQDITLVVQRSRAATAREPAIGFCYGTPLRTEIEAKGPTALAQATDAAAAALVEQYGTGPIEGSMQARVVVAQA